MSLELFEFNGMLLKPAFFICKKMCIYSYISNKNIKAIKEKKCLQSSFSTINTKIGVISIIERIT